MNIKPNKKKLLHSLLLLIFLIILSYLIINYLNNHFYNPGGCTTSIPAQCSDNRISFSVGLIISMPISIIYYLIQSYFEYEKSNN